MATKQIHELQPVAIATAADRIVVSTGDGNLTRQSQLGNIAVRMPGNGAVDRRIQTKLADAVSIRDFGAMGDGTTDDAPAFAAAIAAHRSLFIPSGRYRLATPVDVPPGRTILGAGRDDAEIIAEAATAFVFRRNEGAFAIEPSGADDWCRSKLSGLSIRMTVGGLEVWGHEFRLSDVNFYGGSANGWCIDLVDCNECLVENVSGGYGGGGYRLFAGGIRFRAAKPGVNYGDSLLSEISLKLGSANTVGILLDGSTAGATNWINNMILQRVQVNAPVNGSGMIALAGTVGVKLVNAARINMLDCGVEVSSIGFEEYSQNTGGTAGACVGNNFIGCITHNCPTSYKDSNSIFPRSVIQRTFLGCDNMAPLDSSLEATLGRCQDGDAFFAGAWLFNRQSQPSIQLRSPQTNVLLVAGDNKGALQDKADGHATQDRPYRSLMIDIGSKNSTKLTRPIGIGAPDPDSGSPMLDVRLELGNGEPEPGDENHLGELARIQLNDPVLLRPRATEPLRPVDGLMHFAVAPSALPATGERYLGPGIYARLNGGEYSPVAVQRGAVPERVVHFDWTISANDFGKILRVSHGDPRTITIPAGLVPPGVGARRIWLIREGTGPVSFVAGPGMTLRLPRPELNFIAKQNQAVELVIFGNDTCYANYLDPDVDLRYTLKARTSIGYPNGVEAFHMGNIVHVSHGSQQVDVLFGPGLVPAGAEAAWIKLVKAGNANVRIIATPQMTLKVPGGGSEYIITQPNKMVEVYVTAASGPAAMNGMTNHVYVRD
jgi:hypothetical protein